MQVVLIMLPNDTGSAQGNRHHYSGA